mmetsp:Transcript_25647/g.74145  ORF Transcript_25647/g.74145 Transcript_25647/m.74145 type:complete len:201 (+) Transcript_25647:562-1164(+)
MTVQPSHFTTRKVFHSETARQKRSGNTKENTLMASPPCVIQDSSVPLPSQKSEGWLQTSLRLSSLASWHSPEWKRKVPKPMTSVSMMMPRAESTKPTLFRSFSLMGFISLTSAPAPAPGALPGASAGGEDAGCSTAFASKLAASRSSLNWHQVVRPTLAVMKTRIRESTMRMMEPGRWRLRKTPRKVPSREAGTTSLQML